MDQTAPDLPSIEELQESIDELTAYRERLFQEEEESSINACGDFKVEKEYIFFVVSYYVVLYRSKSLLVL